MRPVQDVGPLIDHLVETGLGKGPEDTREQQILVFLNLSSD